METIQPLSQHLLEYAEQLTSAEGYAEDTGEDPVEAHKAKQIVDRLVRYLVGAAEGLSGRDAAKIAALVKEIEFPHEWKFDEYYTLLLLKRIPKFARRTAKMSPVLAIPSSQKVQSYLKEATRTYIFGFWAASIALSRAAVESALKDKLDAKFGLQQLIKNGKRRGLLDNAHEAMANEVQLKGNDCLHGRDWIPTEEDAWGVLCAARGVIAHILGPLKPYKS